MRLRTVLTWSTPFLLLLGGCIHGEVAQVIPVSGGKTITVELSREGLKPGEADGYKVFVAILQPGKDSKTATYTFGLDASVPPALKRIRIVDISDETEAPLVDVQDPKFEKTRWVYQTPEIPADDPRMKWVFQITGSFRIYQIILTKNDGSEVSFHHITMYPPMVKTLMRDKWGEKY
jgi:hypothetical protein